MEKLKDKIEYSVEKRINRRYSDSKGEYVQFHVHMSIMGHQLGYVVFNKMESGSIVYVTANENKAPYFGINKKDLRDLAAKHMKGLNFRVI